MKPLQGRIVKIVILTASLITLSSCSQPVLGPGSKWPAVASPEVLGYSSEKLAEARKYSETIDTAAMVIVVDDHILCEWGRVDDKFNTHSMRKSFLSALYGRYVADGTIDLDKTMAQLGIDDEPPLTDIEKQATIRDCLKARSGVYHSALYESQGMKDRRPERHTMKPGTHWYYNNWDFNVACTIFEKLTGRKIFEAIEEEIAKPIGMEHFTAEDGTYVTGSDSIHAAYPFRITARDLARFGVLMLHRGRLNGKQLIPADWVDESTAYYSDATLYGCDGYGYMWWISHPNNRYPHLPNVNLPAGTYSARGAGGHYVLVIPALYMVIVHRVDTDKDGNSVSTSEFGKLVAMILDAREVFPPLSDHMRPISRRPSSPPERLSVLGLGLSILHAPGPLITSRPHCTIFPESALVRFAPLRSRRW